MLLAARNVILGSEPSLDKKVRTEFASVPPLGSTNLDYTSNTVSVSMYERYLASCRLVGCAVGLLLGDHGTLMSCKKTGVTTEGDADSVLENDVDLEVGEGVFTQG